MPLSLEYQILTLAPLRLPDGQIRPTHGAPSLAGATLKGAARRSATTIAAVLQQRACQEDGDPSCPICRLFGAPGREGWLRWEPATLDTGQNQTPRPDELEARRRRPVDVVSGRSTVGPTPSRLALPADLLFKARLHGWLAEDGLGDTALLVAALLRLEYLGGGQASGYGRVAVTTKTIRLAGESHDSATLVGSLLALEAV